MNELFTLGDTLRMARERRKLSQQDVAEATRIKVDLIDAIERNDFGRLDVPLYGKGFIRLYAECVGLEPEPLVRDYLERHARSVRPSLRSSRPRTPAAEPLPAMPSGTLAHRRRVDWHALVEEAGHRFREWVARGTVVWLRWRARRRSDAGLRRSRPYRGGAAGWRLPAGLLRHAAVAGAVVALVLLVAGLVRLALRERPAAAAPAAVAASAPATKPVPLRLAEEPPPAYLKLRPPAR